MNYLQLYIPVAVQKRVGESAEWHFELKNLNNLENEDFDQFTEKKEIYEPFVVDDISLDYSKIPSITIISNKLSLFNTQTKKIIDSKEYDSIACPYAPIENNDKYEDSKGNGKVTEEEEEDNADNDSNHQSNSNSESKSKPEPEQKTNKKTSKSTIKKKKHAARKNPKKST